MSSSPNKEQTQIECYSIDKTKPCSDPKFKFNDIYNYFKNRLLEDEQLMIAGSSAYGFAVNDIGIIIPTTHSVKFNKSVLLYNVDRYPLGASFFVRESGVYILFFVCTTDSTCQFSVFVNNDLQPSTCTGTNSGAGQVVSRHMLRLEKDDNVVIRNYDSSSNSIKATTLTGGLLDGNDLTFLIYKIAPLTVPTVLPCNKDKLMDCLSYKNKKLFNKITTQLIADDQLMVSGFNVYGTLVNTVSQSVATESDVIFGLGLNLKGVIWDPLFPEQLKITEDGVYKVFFLGTTNTAAQITICVNGIPNNATTQGTNKGAGQLTIRAFLELKQNDYITVKNHTSANGSIVFSEHAGGFELSNSVYLDIIKTSVLNKPIIKPVNCKLSEYYECYYDKLRDFLLYNDKLLLAGSPSYVSTTSASSQIVKTNQTFHMSTNVIEYNSGHIQGKDFVTIQKSGIYNIYSDIITDEPAQLTLFINGNPQLTSTFGRDSGANRCLMRQVLPLMKDDIIDVRNYSSSGLFVTTAENSGGNYISQGNMFIFLMIAPL